MAVNIGLAGQAGVGKDTVADYLVRRYGFVKYAFSDALYREVATAFGLPDESLLRDRATKEVPSDQLALKYCKDEAFVCTAMAQLMMAMDTAGELPDHVGGTCRDPAYDALSPRQILQWWGTEYRRAQDPDYWIKRTDEWVYDLWASCAYPEQQPQFFVNTTVRFENERRWIHKFSSGNVWHIRRGGVGAVNSHISEQPLKVLYDETVPGLMVPNAKVAYERELYNNDSIDRLCAGVDMLLRSGARFVKVEPMLPYTPPEGDA